MKVSARTNRILSAWNWTREEAYAVDIQFETMLHNPESIANYLVAPPAIASFSLVTGNTSILNLRGYTYEELYTAVVLDSAIELKHLNHFKEKLETSSAQGGFQIKLNLMTNGPD